MRKFLFISLTLSLIFTNSYSEIVKELKVTGNKRVSTETIKLYGEIDINKDYADKDIDRVLKNLYETNFFEDVKIKIVENVLTIDLKEYPIINQLIIIGEKSNRYREQIKKTIRLKEKRSFIKSYLAKDIERIETLYSSIGYNSSKVEAKIKEIDSSNFDLLFTIERGEKTKISSIRFIGNESIRSSRLRDIVASEEDKFWKIISRNTNFSENLTRLDVRLLSNYYKSLGFYDVKVKSNFAEINQSGNADLIYSIDEGQRYTVNKIAINVDKVFDKKLFFPLNKSFEKQAGDYY